MLVSRHPHKSAVLSKLQSALASCDGLCCKSLLLFSLDLLITSAGRASASGGAGAPKQPGLFQMLTTKSVVISCLIFAFQQFAGINAIIYFSSSVFAQVLRCCRAISRAC